MPGEEEDEGGSRPVLLPAPAEEKAISIVLESKMVADPLEASTTTATSTSPPPPPPSSSAAPTDQGSARVSRDGAGKADDVHVDSNLDYKESKEEEVGGDEEDESAVTARTGASTTAHTRTSSLPTAHPLSSCYSEEDETTTVTTTTSLFQKLDGLHARWTSATPSTMLAASSSSSQHSSYQYYDASDARASSGTVHSAYYESSKPYALATQFAKDGVGEHPDGVVDDDDDAASVLSMGSFASSLPYVKRSNRPSGIVSPTRRKSARGGQSRSLRLGGLGGSAATPPPSSRSSSGRPATGSSAKAGLPNSRASVGGASSIAAASTASATTTGTARESVFDRLYNDAVSKSEKKKQRERDKDRDSMYSANSNHSVSFYSARQQLSGCSHTGPCVDDDDDASSIDYEGNDSVFDRLYRNEKRCCRYRHRVSPKNVAPTSLERRLSYKPNFATTTPNLHSPHWQQRLRDANTAAAVVAVPGKLVAQPSVFERLYRNEPRASPVLPPSALRPGPLHRRLSASPRQVKFGTAATTAPLAKLQESSQGSPPPAPPLEPLVKLDATPENSTEASNPRPMSELDTVVDFDSSGHDVAAIIIQSRWRGSLLEREFLRWQSSKVLVPSTSPKLGRPVQLKQEASASGNAEAMTVLQGSPVEEVTSDELHAQINDVAATIVQAKWKCKKQRHYYLAVRYSAVMIQSRFRGFLYRRFVDQRAEEGAGVLAGIACTKVQCWWRMNRAQHSYRAMRLSCVVVQRAVRNHLASRRRARYLAATTMQAAVRRHAALRTWRRLIGAVKRAQRAYRTHRRARLRLSAASRIQNYWRNTVLRRQIVATRALDSCAVTIQAWWRAVSSKRAYTRSKVAAVRLQSLWRSFSCQLVYARQRNAATTIQDVVRRRDHERALNARAATRIQSRWRALNATLMYNFTRNCALLIQRTFRAHLSMVRLKNASATRLAANWRRYAEQRTYWRVLGRVLIIQSAWRQCALARQAKEVERGVQPHAVGDRAACVRVQAWFRTLIVSKSFTYQRHRCILLQALVRGRQSRERIDLQRSRHAAVVLQRHFRGYASRADRDLSCRSAIRLQSLWRGHSSRILARAKLAYSAATTIQCIVRSSRARSNLAIARASATMIQSLVRGLNQQSKYLRFRNSVRALQARARRRRTLRTVALNRRRENAAVRMQAYWRGSLLRSYIILATAAAVVIQSSLRARRGRTLHRMLAQRYSRGAIVVQTAWRSFKYRAAFGRLRISAILIQAIARQRIHHTSYSCLRESSLAVQRSWRNRRAHLKHHYAATTIQAIARRRIGTNQYKLLLSRVRMDKAATTIQSNWRSIKPRSDLLIAVAAAVMIQAGFRGHRAKRALSSVCRSILTVQKHTRRYLSRSHYSRCKLAAVTLQASWRGSLARSHYTHACVAAAILQSTFRGLNARSRFLRLRQAAVTVQSYWRRSVALSQLAISLCAATMIQAAVRGLFQRQLDADSRVAATQIQCIARVAQARRRYDRVRSAFIRLQAAGRAVVVRKRYHELRKAAMRIQSWWRFEDRRRRVALATELATRLQALSRGAILRSRLRLQHQSAATIQAVFRSLAGMLAVRRQRILAARVIQWHWRAFASRRKFVIYSHAARTIQLWHLSILLRVQHVQLQSSAAVLARCVDGSLRRDLSLFSLVRINGFLRSSALQALTRLERQHGQSLVSADVHRVWDQVMGDIRHLAAVLVQCVVRSYLCRRAICGRTRGSPSPRRRQVAVRVLTPCLAGSVDVELCPILQEQRRCAANVLQRFFLQRVRRIARASQVRVETEWIKIRAERSATKLVQELSSKDFDVQDDNGWRDLGYCIPRLVRRARTARDLYEKVLHSRDRIRDGQTKVAHDKSPRSPVPHDAWNY